MGGGGGGGGGGGISSKQILQYKVWSDWKQPYSETALEDQVLSQGLYSLTGWTSYGKISWSLKVMRFKFWFFYDYEILQSCQDACKISEWNNHYNTQTCSFKASRDLTVRYLTT